MRTFIVYDYYGNRREIQARGIKSARKSAAARWGCQCNVYPPELTLKK